MKQLVEQRLLVYICLPLNLNFQERPILKKLRYLFCFIFFIYSVRLFFIIIIIFAKKFQVDQWLTFCNTTIKPAIQGKVMKATRDFARVCLPFLFSLSYSFFFISKKKKQFLNDLLLTRVYFCANFLTVADLIIYANLYSYMVCLLN